MCLALKPLTRPTPPLNPIFSGSVLVELRVGFSRITIFTVFKILYHLHTRQPRALRARGDFLFAQEFRNQTPGQATQNGGTTHNHPKLLL